MVFTYVLTFLIPGDSYTRVPDENGNMIIDAPDYRSVEGGLPFRKWIFSS